MRPQRQPGLECLGQVHLGPAAMVENVSVLSIGRARMPSLQPNRASRQHRCRRISRISVTSRHHKRILYPAIGRLCSITLENNILKPLQRRLGLDRVTQWDIHVSTSMWSVRPQETKVTKVTDDYRDMKIDSIYGFDGVLAICRFSAGTDN